jgi:FtsH-binding integral membrane protein
MRRPAAAAVAASALDACMVLAFVVIGRASHHQADGLAGVIRTFWPFLAGLAVGEVATRSWKRPMALVPTGVGVWLSTVALGMILRVVAGQGTAVAFILVALAFLGLFLLGWRIIAARVPAVARAVSARR